MALKKRRKESDKELMAAVRKEMGRPRMTESAQEKLAKAAAARVANTDS